MKSNCPECGTRLNDFAVACDDCGWELAINQNDCPQRSGAVVDPAEQSQSVNGFPTNGSKQPVPMEIEEQIQRAILLIEQEDFPAALTILNQAAIDAPPERLAECFSLRGFVHLKNQDFSRAEDDCSEAISHDWDEAQTYAWRAAARGEQNKWRLAFDDLDRACELAGPSRDQYLKLLETYSETASDYFRQLVKAGKDTADMFFERGWMYFRTGKYLKAERDFQHALRLQADHPWASVGLAQLQLHEHQQAGVRELCELALAGDDQCRRRALILRAELNHQQQRIRAVRQDLDSLAKLAANDAKLRVQCAKLRSNYGDHVTAIDELTAVLKEAPGHYLAMLVRGDCFSEIRNYEMAIRDYSQYLEYYPDDVLVLIQRAKALLATRRFEAAQIDLGRVFRIDNTVAEAYLVRSKVFLEQQQFDSALTECRRAVRLDNQRSESFAVLAAIYHGLCDYGNAIEEYSRSIELARDSDEKAQYLYLCGIEYYELEEFGKAFRCFKKSCKLRPNHAGCWIWKAATSARLERWAKAILGLQQAIQVRPSAADQYQKLGRPVAEKAIEFFNRQQQRGHDNADLHRKRGLAYQFLGNDDNAIADYTWVLEQEPDDVETLIRRAQVSTRSADNLAAVEDLTRVIRKDKANHRARYCRAIARLAQGKYAEAKKDLQKSIKTAPNHPGYHILLGELLQKMGDAQGVIEAFDRAILQDPTNPVTYRQRGVAHLSSGNLLNAISDYTRSLELYPSQMDLLVQRGQAYIKIGQPLLALEDFEVALTHNERLAKAYSGRATVLVTQGRHEYALIWLTKAIHRFSDPRELAEIVFARGKVFFQMGRLAPSIVDFTTVIELMRSDKKTVAAARYARAIAYVNLKQYDDAQRDFRKLVAIDPANQRFQAAMEWLEDREKPVPQFLERTENVQRPTRPPVVRNGTELSQRTIAKWQSETRYDSWVLRTIEKREYGPVHFGILKTWVQDGRVDVGMRLLRADWSKWKRVESILPEITPAESIPGMIEEFPELDLGRHPTEVPNEDM